MQLPVGLNRNEAWRGLSDTQREARTKGVAADEQGLGLDANVTNVPSFSKLLPSVFIPLQNVPRVYLLLQGVGWTPTGDAAIRRFVQLNQPLCTHLEADEERQQRRQRCVVVVATDTDFCTRAAMSCPLACCDCQIHGVLQIMSQQ
ncbi:hypothetical protein OPV22_014775 [Ensete ventricosum]|uniref:NYN domain-containing protein n=1 Tax=Ensete ventricosum TaxID=4639 RepID=A0AAV8PR07_ENSVE|nr:hypothetical protein OPV22_014775 [Ensete ventricosum]